jgi:O-acetyl-ADP-ribose deacetylase (regulator of RNase III)
VFFVLVPSVVTFSFFTYTESSHFNSFLPFMISTLTGNALDAPRGVFVHGCNAQGKMGSGVALEVRQRFPAAYEAYMSAHRQGLLVLGSTTEVEVSPGLWIVNGVTQQYYGRDPGRVYVDYPAIERVFLRASNLATQHQLPLLFPLIGCGLGGGEWPKVEAIIERCVDPSVEKTLFVLPPLAPVPRRFTPN